MPTTLHRDNTKDSQHTMNEVDPLANRIERLHAELRRELAEIIAMQNERLLQQHTSLKPLMSVKEVARTLGVSERTVETLVAGGKLRPLWIKGQRRFHPDAIDAFIRAGERKEQRRTRRTRR